MTFGRILMTCTHYLTEKYGLADGKKSDLRKKEESEKKKALYKYTKQAEWRSVHRRLRSFVRCVDFLIMDLLKRVVDFAVTEIVMQIETTVNLNEKPKPRTIDWSEMKRNANKSSSDFFKVEPKIVPPMFELNLLLEERKQSVKRKSASKPGMIFHPFYLLYLLIIAFIYQSFNC